MSHSYLYGMDLSLSRSAPRIDYRVGVQEMWEAQRSGGTRVPVSKHGTPDFYNDESAALLHSYGYSYSCGCSLSLG